MTDSAETMRAHKHVMLNADGDIWTAGIDIRENNGDWHYSAVECHSVDRELAIARRDTVFAALSASGTKSEIDEAGLERAVRECARITAPEITDSEYEAIRERRDPRYINTRGEMRRALTAYLGEANAVSIKPGPSDPIPSQPDEREAIARIINPKAFDESYWARGRQREKTYALERAAAILAMQAERRGATRPTIPTCCVTGAIPGDGGACGDCDPCTLGENMVPDAVKRLIAEKNSLLQRVGELEDQLHEAPANPAPIAGLEPVAWRFTKLSVWHVTSERNWAEAHGDCIEPLYTRAQLEAHAAEQVRPLVEALEGLIEAVELDADEGLEGIGSYTGARLTDAKNAIRARGQV